MGSAATRNNPESSRMVSVCPRRGRLFCRFVENRVCFCAVDSRIKFKSPSYPIPTANTLQLFEQQKVKLSCLYEPQTSNGSCLWLRENQTEKSEDSIPTATSIWKGIASHDHIKPILRVSGCFSLRTHTFALHFEMLKTRMTTQRQKFCWLGQTTTPKRRELLSLADQRTASLVTSSILVCTDKMLANIPKN